MHTQSLSLRSAILINLNIMMGTGIFINTVELAKRASILSAFSYAFVGILIFPLILCIAQLIRLYPSGGFYAFAQESISPFIAFISTWSYFIAKLASATLMIHVAMSLITQLFPRLFFRSYIILYDLFILIFFISLNLLHLKTGSRIQMSFLGFKLLPILFVILAGTIFIGHADFTAVTFDWSTIPSTLPFVLYAVLGFEAMSAISNKIENPKKNGPRAIFIAFTILMTLIILFQFFMYSISGPLLTAQPNYLFAFPTFLQKIFVNKIIIQKLVILFHLAIAFSALGGCYGILFSNNWNLFILADQKKLKPHYFLTSLNQYGIPYVCLAVQGLFCLFYLFISGGNQLFLQPLAAFGTTITYLISVIALTRSLGKSMSFMWSFIVLAGIFSCCFLLYTCVKNFLEFGAFPLVCFLIFLIGGILLYNKKP